jgi:hypothetical protein
VLRTSTSPSPGIGASVSTRLKSLSLIAPFGRREQPLAVLHGLSFDGGAALGHV